MERPVIEFGLVMAGAVSAGAYTAGVLDFLIEALDAFEAEKAKGNADFPNHDVKLRVVSGTSAGGINAALLAIALEGQFAPVRAASVRRQANPFHSAWVDDIDLAKLFGTDALGQSGGNTQAILDGRALEAIADAALGFPKGAPRPAYVSDTLDLFVTLTNLRGVPYAIDLIGSAIRDGQPAGYEMIAHADYIRFANGLKTTDEAHPLETDNRQGPGWTLLREAALASAAFPGAFPARHLRRPAGDYAARRWRVPHADGQTPPGLATNQLKTIAPSWLLPPEEMVELLCVDGGVLNNEPIELTRRVLEDEGQSDAQALILIDPFPRIGQYDPHEALPGGLAGLFFQLASATRAQASFKPEELVQALERDVHTRFLITPRRANDEGTLLPYPLAGGGLGGFAGFLDRQFREHDFLLGRRNCQRFLARHFALPCDHPAVAGWSQAADRAHGIWAKGVAPTLPAPMRPIIPLVGSARQTCPSPEWPAIAPRALTRVERLARRRFGAVAKGLVRQYLGVSLIGWIASAVIALEQGRASRQIRSHLHQVLHAREQIAGARKSRKAPARPPTVAVALRPAPAIASPALRLFKKRREAKAFQTIGWGHSIDALGTDAGEG